MRQAQIDVFGEPDVLHTVEHADPVASPDEVLIEVDAAGITFVETQMRAGRFHPPGQAPIELPAVLGNGVEGRISGSGQRVVTATGGLGGYRSLVAVDRQNLFPIPEHMERGVAVAMLADGRTALAQLRAAPPAPGDRVLVLAASGGVGSLIVQLAIGAGATVIAAAGGTDKCRVAEELGAHTSVDYLRPDWGTSVLDSAPVDIVFDGVGGDLGRHALATLGVDSRRVAYGMASGTWVNTPDDDRRIVTCRGGPSDPADNRALVESALEMARAGTLRPIVGQAFALDDAARAHRAIEARATVGKTLLIP